MFRCRHRTSFIIHIRTFHLELMGQKLSTLAMKTFLRLKYSRPIDYVAEHVDCFLFD